MTGTLIEELATVGPTSMVAFLCVTCIDRIVQRDWSTFLYFPPVVVPEGFLPTTPQSAFEQLLSFLVWHVVLRADGCPSTHSMRGNGSLVRVGISTVATMIKGGLLDYPAVCSRHIGGVLGSWGGCAHHAHPLVGGTGLRAEWASRRDANPIAAPQTRNHKSIFVGNHLRLLRGIVGAYTLLSPVTNPHEHKASANLFKASILDDIFATVGTMVVDLASPHHDVLDPEPTSFSLQDAAALYSRYPPCSSADAKPSFPGSSEGAAESRITAETSSDGCLVAEVGAQGKRVLPNQKRPRSDEAEECDERGAAEVYDTFPDPPVSPYASVLLATCPPAAARVATSVPQGISSRYHWELVRCIDWSVLGNAHIKAPLLVGFRGPEEANPDVGLAVEEVHELMLLLESTLGFDFMCVAPSAVEVPSYPQPDLPFSFSTVPQASSTPPTSPLLAKPSPPQAGPSPTLHVPSSWHSLFSPSDPSRSLLGAVIAIYVGQCSPLRHSRANQQHAPISGWSFMQRAEQAMRSSGVPEVAMRTLVQLVSCRRTLFVTPSQRGLWLRQILAACVFLFRNPVHFRSGAPAGLSSLSHYYNRSVSASESRFAWSLVVPAWFHPQLAAHQKGLDGGAEAAQASSIRESFSLLLTRIKPNHQLSELLAEGILYEVWVHLAAAFTVDFLLLSCQRDGSQMRRTGPSRFDESGVSFAEHQRVYRELTHSFIGPALECCFKEGYHMPYYANPLLGLFESGSMSSRDASAADRHWRSGGVTSSIADVFNQQGSLPPSEEGTVVGCGVEGNVVVGHLMALWRRLNSALVYTSNGSTGVSSPQAAYNPTAPCAHSYVDALLPEIALAVCYSWIECSSCALPEDLPEHDSCDGDDMGTVLRQVFPVVGAAFGALAKALSDRCVSAVTKVQHETDMLGCESPSATVDEAIQCSGALKAYTQFGALLRLLTPVLQIRAVPSTSSSFLVSVGLEIGRQCGSNAGASTSTHAESGSPSTNIGVEPPMRKGELAARKAAATALRSSASSRRTSPVVPSQGGPFPTRRLIHTAANPSTLEECLVRWDAQIVASALGFAAALLRLDGPGIGCRDVARYQVGDMSLLDFLNVVINGVYMAAFGLSAASASSSSIYGTSSSTVTISAPATVARIVHEAPLSSDLVALLPPAWRDERGSVLQSPLDRDVAEVMVRLVALNVQLLGATRALQVWGGARGGNPHDGSSSAERIIVRKALQLLLCAVEHVQFSDPYGVLDVSPCAGGARHPGGFLPWYVQPPPSQATHDLASVATLWRAVASTTAFPFPLLEHIATAHSSFVLALHSTGSIPNAPTRRLRMEVRGVMCNIFFSHLRQRAELVGPAFNDQVLRAQIEGLSRPMLVTILRAYENLTQPASSQQTAEYSILNRNYTIDLSKLRDFTVGIRSGDVGVALVDLRGTISALLSRSTFRRGCVEVLLSSAGGVSGSNTSVADAILHIAALCGSHDREGLDAQCGLPVRKEAFEFTLVQALRLVLEVLDDRSGRLGGASSNGVGDGGSWALTSNDALCHLWRWALAMLVTTVSSQHRCILNRSPSNPQHEVSYVFAFKAGGYLPLQLCARLMALSPSVAPTPSMKGELAHSLWFLLHRFTSKDLVEFPKLSEAYHTALALSRVFQLQIPLAPPAHCEGIDGGSFYWLRPLLFSEATTNHLQWSDNAEQFWARESTGGCSHMLVFALAQPSDEFRSVLENLLMTVKSTHSSRQPAARRALLASLSALADLLESIAAAHRTLQLSTHAHRLRQSASSLSREAQIFIGNLKTALRPPHPAVYAAYETFVGSVLSTATSDTEMYDSVVVRSDTFGGCFLREVALSAVMCVLCVEGGSETIGHATRPGWVSDADIRAATARLLVPLFIVYPPSYSAAEDFLVSRARAREACGASKRTLKEAETTSESIVVRRWRQVLDGLHPSCDISCDGGGSLRPHIPPTGSLRSSTGAPSTYYNPVTYDCRLSHHGVHIGDPASGYTVTPADSPLSKETLHSQSTLQLHLWLGHDLQNDGRTVDRLNANLKQLASSVGGLV